MALTSKLLKEGDRNPAIAQKLDAKEDTTKTHIHNIFLEIVASATELKQQLVCNPHPRVFP